MTVRRRAGNSTHWAVTCCPTGPVTSRVCVTAPGRAARISTQAVLQSCSRHGIPRHYFGAQISYLRLPEIVENEFYLGPALDKEWPTKSYSGMTT
ncbi:hypothetical protein Cst04h_17820 [Corynebacterium striatum]|uniref:Uncharacterized protein n=1 Tax=Corynebacterium striatum TaxID=43770 RepID=A0ABC9ZNJ3_CORST|nr:hypothetical protein Cst04h_17820 [Corynebacterium striatum]